MATGLLRGIGASVGTGAGVAVPIVALCVAAGAAPGRGGVSPTQAVRLSAADTRATAAQVRGAPARRQRDMIIATSWSPGRWRLAATPPRPQYAACQASRQQARAHCSPSWAGGVLAVAIGTVRGPLLDTVCGSCPTAHPAGQSHLDAQRAPDAIQRGQTHDRDATDAPQDSPDKRREVCRASRSGGV